MEEKTTNEMPAVETKFCKECGQKIARKAVVCPHCGCQVEALEQASTNPQIVISNSNANTSTNVNTNTNTNTNTVAVATCAPKAKNKWVAFVLCLLLGYFGAHKFYEEKIGMGLLYLFTAGLFCIGWLVDCVLILLKPNPYYV